MPRAIVVNENGTTTWDERVTAADFETEHFQRCLAERLSLGGRRTRKRSTRCDALLTCRQAVVRFRNGSARTCG